MFLNLLVRRFCFLFHSRVFPLDARFVSYVCCVLIAKRVSGEWLRALGLSKRRLREVLTERRYDFLHVERTLG